MFLTGSAYGGKWKPKTPENQRFFGEPGEIKKTWISTKRGGYWVETKIGEDGRAIMERHYTDHGRNDPNDPKNFHTDPHDHPVFWDENTGFPSMPIRINYPTDDVPEF